MSKILEGLKYSESHEWVKVEGNVAVIGVSDYAQKEMGDITYVDLPEEGDDVLAGEEFGALESVKAASDLISPVSGTVVAVNGELEDGTEVGVVTTGYHSISLDKSICFALVDKAYAALDTPLWIHIRKKVFPGKVVKKRFYQTNYKK